MPKPTQVPAAGAERPDRDRAMKLARDFVPERVLFDNAVDICDAMLEFAATDRETTRAGCPVTRWSKIRAEQLRNQKFEPTSKPAASEVG